MEIETGRKQIAVTASVVGCIDDNMISQHIRAGILAALDECAFEAVRQLMDLDDLWISLRKDVRYQANAIPIIGTVS